MHKICHLTSVHNRYDPRILLKQCVSIVKKGFDTTLIVANGLENEIYKGVKIVDVGKPKSRFYRIFITAIKIYKKAIQVSPDIYHFHDPELMLIGILLRLKGKKVIYDIHEDYYTAIKQKQYLHKTFSIIIAWCISKLEKIGSSFFYQVIAEKYYKERFPKATEILNYPIIDKEEYVNVKVNEKDYKLIYTGNVTIDRGAMNHSDLINSHSSIKVYFIGKCSEDLSKRIQANNTQKEKLFFDGIERYVPFEKIKEYYVKNSWLAALAIFPKTEHYYQKELTKFFEYMYFGIPILCSNFPVWKSLIEDNGVGLTVNPENRDEIDRAIEWLIANPRKRLEMGKRGYKAAIEKYNWDIQLEKLLKLYNDILIK